METAISQSDLVRTATRLIGGDRAAPRAPVKKTGLEDGVRLLPGRTAHG